MFSNKRCCNNMPCCNMNQCNNVVVEPTINKCVEKQFCHEVPHVCPIHTHVVNKHVYNHSYTPQYTCSEENVIINNDNGSCSQY